jgi:hypothetical protein
MVDIAAGEVVDTINQFKKNHRNPEKAKPEDLRHNRHRELHHDREVYTCSKH